LVTVALGVLGSAGFAQSLESRIGKILDNTQLRNASVSLDIQEVTARGPVALFSRNPLTPLGPASNTKLLTTAAAFEKYGANATFKTHLYQVGPDLLLVGGGDPGFGDAKICTAAGETPTTAFERWATHLRQLGVHTFRNLIVDDRVFDDAYVHPNWPADQQLDWYSAPIAGLNFNANCLDWIPKLTAGGVSVELMPNTSYVSVTVKASKGSETRVSMLRPPESNKFEMRGTVAQSATTPYWVTIHDPGMWTGTILRDTLLRAGIQQSGQVRRTDSREKFATGNLVGTHETPLMAVLQRANTNSVNMMAEGLCKRLGYDATGRPGTWASGTAAIEAYAATIGVNPNWISLDDGSGLSKQNRVAARALTTVLAHVAGRPDGRKYIDTLAEPGEQGTLQKRFKGLKVADHVRAKTGHISGVSALSGYVFAGNRTFAFSILINKYEGNVNPIQDQVCQAVYEWAGGK
jgi:D-alanyl-D-alanine carboxypeptidase/D-alanyl-D-alanine-endopeptidase (penicillin-binding protein 4)